MNNLTNEMNPWTLKFNNEELEKSYQTTRMKLKDISLFGKIFIAYIIAAIIIRKFHLIYLAIKDDNSDLAWAEVRCTLEVLLGIFLEIPLVCISRLNFLRGTPIFVLAYLAICDMSLVYYPYVPAVVPIAIPTVAYSLLLAMFYMHGWSVTFFCLVINSIVETGFIFSGYTLNTIDIIFYAPFGLVTGIAYAVSTYTFELHDRKTFYVMNRYKLDKSNLKRLLKKLADGVVVCCEDIEKIILWNKSMIGIFENIDPLFSAAYQKAQEKQEKKDLVTGSFFRNIVWNKSPARYM